MDRIRRAVETLANVAFLVACLTVTAYFVSQWTRGNTTAATAEENTPFPSGSQMRALPEVSFADSDVSAILFIQSGCRFCTESMPFYRAISKLRSSQRAFRLLAASFEDESVLASYIGQHQLDVDRIVRITVRDYGISGTPTLVLVDERGAVLGSWQGLMNDDQEGVALAVIRGERQNSS